MRHIARLDWSKTQKISKLTRGEQSGKQAGKQASRRASKWVSLLRQILFIILGDYFNDLCYTFDLGQMFIRFLSIIFDIY